MLHLTERKRSIIDSEFNSRTTVTVSLFWNISFGLPTSRVRFSDDSSAKFHDSTSAFVLLAVVLFSNEHSVGTNNRGEYEDQ